MKYNTFIAGANTGLLLYGWCFMFLKHEWWWQMIPLSLLIFLAIAFNLYVDRE